MSAQKRDPVKEHYHWADRRARRTARVRSLGPDATQAHRDWQAGVLADRYNHDAAYRAARIADLLRRRLAVAVADAKRRGNGFLYQALTRKED